MAHQSPHHYANALDWGNFKLSKSVGGEKMFEEYTPDQPQGLSTNGHLGNGPWSCLAFRSNCTQGFAGWLFGY